MTQRDTSIERRQDVASLRMPTALDKAAAHRESSYAPLSLGCSGGSLRETAYPASRGPVRLHNPFLLCSTRIDWDGGLQMITGMHAVLFTTDADVDRTFFRDVLEFPSVDAGGGWLIFALPPAELAAHPAEENGRHELYLMCDDVNATVGELNARGAEIPGPVKDEGFGLLTAIRLPGGGELGLYQPKHPSPLAP